MRPLLRVLIMLLPSLTVWWRMDLQVRDIERRLWGELHGPEQMRPLYLVPPRRRRGPRRGLYVVGRG